MSIFSKVIFLLFILPTSILQAQVILQLETTLEEEKYCAKILLYTDGISEPIGTSSFFLRYNAAALNFESYESFVFDNHYTCQKGLIAYTDHAIDASNDGLLSITIELTDPEIACPKLGKIPTVVAQVCFEVEDCTQTSNLYFDERLTSINKIPPTFEIFEIIELVNANDRLDNP